MPARSRRAAPPTPPSDPVRRGRAVPIERTRDRDGGSPEPGSSATLALQLPAGVVEVVPTGTIAHDSLEVLAPGHAVVDRILDHGADDAGSDIGRVELTVAEVRS